MTLGLGEIIVLGFILLVVFSAARMGQLGNALGRFVHSFRKASQGGGYVDAQSRSLSRRDKEESDAEFTDEGRRRR